MQALKNWLVKAALTGGWKTYSAAIGGILVGLGSLLTGAMGFDQATAMILAGLAVFGLGHKLAKLLAVAKRFIDLVEGEANRG